MKERIKGIIYKYTNRINGKVYIGQTVDEKQRIREHRNLRGDFPFHRAIRKYGWDNFEYEVVFTTISSDKDRLKLLLDTMEKYFIRKFNSFGKSGYNCTLGGGGQLGYHHSEETKKKIQETRKRRGIKSTISDKARENCIQARKKSTSQYTLDGVLICTFSSAVEAAMSINKKDGYKNISSCARGERRWAYGYIWRYSN